MGKTWGVTNGEESAGSDDALERPVDPREQILPERAIKPEQPVWIWKARQRFNVAAVAELLSELLAILVRMFILIRARKGRRLGAHQPRTLECEPALEPIGLEQMTACGKWEL